MSKTPITASQAVELMEEFSTEDFRCDLDYLKDNGFEIVTEVGSTQAAAATKAAPKPALNDALIADVIALVRKGRKVKGTKTGRQKWVLGTQEKLGAYKVIITADKGAKLPLAEVK